MKNREKLSNMAIYDLLKKIEDYVSENIATASVSDRIFCIQEVFDPRFTIINTIINELGYKQHVCPYGHHEFKGLTTTRDCQNCLNNWLNEEVYDNE